MATFDTDCDTIFYRNWLADGPLAQIVFIHGFGEHTAHYQRFAAAMNARRISVWGLDQPGHGQSTGERGRVASFEPAIAATRMLLSLATAASPELPTVLMGHSLGGTTVALLACREALGANVRGLVLTGTVLTDSAYTIPETVVVTEDEGYLKLLAEDPLKFDVTSERLQERRDVTALVRKEIEPGLVSLDLPMLLINGEADTIAPPEFNSAYARRLKRARFHSFSGGHHDILNDRMHEEVGELIAAFVIEAASQS